MKAIEYLISVRDVAKIPLYSKEKCGKGKPCISPSNSEMKRWLDKGSIEINGKYPKPFDDIGDKIDSLVLFWKSDNRITLVKSDGMSKEIGAGNYYDREDKTYKTLESLYIKYNSNMLARNHE